ALHLSGSNDHIRSPRVLCDQVSASAERFFGKLDGISPSVLGLNAPEVDLKELGSERSNVFTGGSANIISLDHCAKPPGRRDCLQARHTSAEDQNFRGSDSTRRSHQQRKHAWQSIGG